MAEGSDKPMVGEEATWGPYPGDALAPPPTPKAPEIPMSEAWPWIAGVGVALRILVPLVVVLGIVGLVIALIVHAL
jgi:hypothetical protein